MEHQVLVKVPYHDGRRQRQEYRLTQAGADLAPVLHALADWGHRHTHGAAPNAPVESVHAGCGGQIRADRSCAGCGATVTRDEEAWIPTWRSGEPVPLARPWPGEPPGPDGPDRGTAGGVAPVTRSSRGTYAQAVTGAGSGAELGQLGRHHRLVLLLVPAGAGRASSGPAAAGC